MLILNLFEFMKNFRNRAKIGQFLTMATITIILDKKKNNQRKDGTYPIKMKVEHGGSHLPINLKKYAKIEAWTKDKLNSKFPNYKRVNHELNEIKVTAGNILKDYENEIRTWSCRQLRDFIVSGLLEEKSKKRDKEKWQQGIHVNHGIKTVKLFEYGKELVAYCEKNKLFGRAKSYKQAMNAFLNYTDFTKEVTFAEITGDVLEAWKIRMMNKPMKDTSYNAYLRGLRAVINKGIKARKVSREGNYGFADFVVGTPQETEKRAIDLESIRKIFGVHLDYESSMWHTQQQAIFMFNTNGINFKDLAYLKIGQIVGDYERIKYRRAKNHKDFDVVIAGKSKEILQYYIGDRIQKKNELIFPILRKEVLGQGKKESTLYDSQLKVFNDNLNKIAKKSGVKGNITTYVLRHSFATGLKHSGVDIAYISEMLGHDSIDTTQIYLDSFETNKKDAVTQSIAM